MQKYIVYIFLLCIVSNNHIQASRAKPKDIQNEIIEILNRSSSTESSLNVLDKIAVYYTFLLLKAHPDNLAIIKQRLDSFLPQSYHSDILDLHTYKKRRDDFFNVTLPNLLQQKNNLKPDIMYSIEQSVKTRALKTQNFLNLPENRALKLPNFLPDRTESRPLAYNEYIFLPSTPTTTAPKTSQNSRGMAQNAIMQQEIEAAITNSKQGFDTLEKIATYLAFVEHAKHPNKGVDQIIQSVNSKMSNKYLAREQYNTVIKNVFEVLTTQHITLFSKHGLELYIKDFMSQYTYPNNSDQTPIIASWPEYFPSPNLTDQDRLLQQQIKTVLNNEKTTKAKKQLLTKIMTYLALLELQQNPHLDIASIIESIDRKIPSEHQENETYTKIILSIQQDIPTMTHKAALEDAVKMYMKKNLKNIQGFETNPTDQETVLTSPTRHFYYPVLLLENVPVQTTNEELTAFFKPYGIPTQIQNISENYKDLTKKILITFYNDDALHKIKIKFLKPNTQNSVVIPISHAILAKTQNAEFITISEKPIQTIKDKTKKSDTPQRFITPIIGTFVTQNEIQQFQNPKKTQVSLQPKTFKSGTSRPIKRPLFEQDTALLDEIFNTVVKNQLEKEQENANPAFFFRLIKEQFFDTAKQLYPDINQEDLEKIESITIQPIEHKFIQSFEQKINTTMINLVDTALQTADLSKIKSDIFTHNVLNKIQSQYAPLTNEQINALHSQIQTKIRFKKLTGSPKSLPKTL